MPPSACPGAFAFQEPHAVDRRYDRRDDPVGVPGARGGARPDPWRPHDAVDHPGRHHGRGPGRAGHGRAGRDGRPRLPASGQGGRDRHPPGRRRARRQELAGGRRAGLGRERGDGPAQRDPQLPPGLRQRGRARTPASRDRADRPARRRGEPLVEAARARREHRLARFEQRAGRVKDITTDDDADFRWRFQSLALGPARGRAVREHDVPGQDADGAGRGGRDPVDAVLQGARHDGVRRRHGFLLADLDPRGRHVQGGAQPRRQLVPGDRRQGARRDAVERRDPPRVHGVR